MKIRALIISGFLLTTVIVHAQTDFRPGYIIKSEGDTVSGELDYRGDILLSEICTFKPAGGSEVIKFSPGAILGYRFNNGRFFVSKEIKGAKVFLEYLIKGQVSIYYMRDKTGDRYFIDKADLGITEIEYKEVEKGDWENGQTPYLYKSNKHIGILSFYMQDAPGFQSRIEKIGEPDHDNLIRLAKEYQVVVSKDKSCIIFEQKQPFLKVKFGLAAGTVNYRKIEDLVDKKYFQSGIIADICLPRFNEKIYLRTGLLYSTLDYSDKRYSMYKVPVYFEYIYPVGIFRPSLAYGVDLLFSTQLGQMDIMLSGGVEVKVTKFLFLTINYGMAFQSSEKVMILPGSTAYQSLLLGFQLKF